MPELPFQMPELPFQMPELLFQMSELPNKTIQEQDKAIQYSREKSLELIELSNTDKVSLLDPILFVHVLYLPRLWRFQHLLQMILLKICMKRFQFHIFIFKYIKLSDICICVNIFKNSLIIHEKTQRKIISVSYLYM
jgi:hypothetical protein